MGSHGPRVFSGLAPLYDICKEFGAKVMAMTMMETIADMSLRAREECRQELSDKIRKYAAANKDKVDVLVDLERLIRFHGIPEAELAKYWDDGAFRGLGGGGWGGAGQEIGRAHV